MIYVKTGNGGDKTTSAMGLAARALGNGKKVVIIQFMKARFTGERELLSKFNNCVFKQFGRKEFVNLKRPDEIDIKLARKGLYFAFDVIKKKPFLLVLDEVNLACAIGLVNVSDVVSLLSKCKGIEVVLTGRRAPKELIKKADFVTRYTDLKRRDVVARAGIEF